MLSMYIYIDDTIMLGHSMGLTFDPRIKINDSTTAGICMNHSS